MNNLKPLDVPASKARLLVKRIQPLHERFWKDRGLMSIEDALLSAYLQGVADCAELSKMGQLPPYERS